MKILTTLVAMLMIATVLALAALVQLMISLAPFLALALIAILLLRARRPTVSPAAGWTGCHPPEVAAPSQCRLGAPTAASGGWVMVPVWVAPQPGPRIIDGEVLGDRG